MATASWFVSFLEIETSTDSLLNRFDPAWGFYQGTSLPLFGADEVIVVAIESSEPFDRVALEKVVELTAALEVLPQVRRVDSLATVPLIRIDPDGALNLDSGLATGLPESPDEWLRFTSAVRADRIATRSLVSDDGRTFAINVLPEDDADFEALVSSLEEVVADSGAWVSGVPIFRVATSSRTRSEILLFVPLTIVTMAVFLAAVFRSGRAVVIPMIVSGVGTWVVLGALGLGGTPLTATTVILPPVLLALGTAYTMHLLTAALAAAPEDLAAALTPVADPVALSGLTTALGLVSMAIVQIDSIRFVALYGSIGVLVVLLATLTLAPALLRTLRVPARELPAVAWIRGNLLPALVRVSASRLPVLLGWAVLVSFAGIGIGILRVESDVTLWFQRGTEIRDSYETIRDRLSGISPLNVVIQSTAGAPVSSAEALRAIDEFSSHIEGLDTVGKTLSVADPVRQLHQGFSEDTDAALPSDDALIEQYLLILDSVDELRDVVTVDRSAANIMIRADANGSVDLLGIASEAEAWWEANGPEGFSAQPSGIMLQFARAQDEISFGQIRGLAIAFLTIGIVLIGVFRNVGAALMALVPNVAPILIAFGAMGWLGVPLDAGTVFLGSLALGIAVDDTIHLATAFVAETGRGRAGTEALSAAFERVLPAISLTTIVTGLGFLILGFSGFLFIRNLGLLTSSLMLLCLLADVTLLAVLLVSRIRPKAPVS